jgi:hypothetical protein
MEKRYVPNIETISTHTHRIVYRNRDLFGGLRERYAASWC